MLTRIPRIIHSAWFGQGDKPPLIQRCQRSWRQHLHGSNWVFQEWDESNFYGLDSPYAMEAFKRRRWAFVTDYLRLRVLYEFGGIYLDADVEVLRPLDRFLDHRAFTGHEADQWWLSATMGAERGHPWIKMLLDHYERQPYIERANTQVVTELSQPWLEQEGAGYRYLREGVVIYPTAYFTGFDHTNMRPIVTEESHTTHWFAGSWLGRPDPLVKPTSIIKTAQTAPIVRTAQQLRRR